MASPQYSAVGYGGGGGGGSGGVYDNAEDPSIDNLYDSALDPDAECVAAPPAALRSRGRAMPMLVMLDRRPAWGWTSGALHQTLL